jgi:CRISPR-associated protein Cmr3
MILRINALDTLFFRNGKPFSMGEDTWADGVFPPYPSVLYGALRTWYVANQAGGVTQSMIDESGNMSITAIHYRIPGGLYLPLPLDMVEPKNKSVAKKNEENRKKEYEVVKLALAENTADAKLSSTPEFFNALLMPDNQQEVESVQDGLISVSNFKQYLEGGLQEAKIQKISDFAQVEPKIGVGRDDNTNAAADSMLYRVGMRRMNGFEMIAELKLPKEDFQHEATFIKLGAEGKIASFSDKGRMDALKLDKATIDLQAGQFKLYLATPAIFKKGWQPDLAGFGIQADLITAAVGKPGHIGGFDMANRSPKPMYKAVPAGSVYYYRTKESVEDVLEKLQGESVSDFMGEQGFGIAYIGNF